MQPTAIPLPGTPAHQAMSDQGNVRYPGVDHWENPRKGLAAGTLLVQFDHRDADLIKKGTGAASVYFTDAETLSRHINGHHVNAQGLAEDLQVGPYRPDPATEHTYSRHVAIYRLQRDLQPEQVRVTQPAEFGEGQTRNNVHWGEGVGKQYFVTVPRDQLLGGTNPLLKLDGVLPCTNRNHRLGWLQELERQPEANKQAAHVEEAIARAFESRVAQLAKGTPEQQQQARQIVELQAVRRSFDEPGAIKAIDTTSLKKLPEVKPAVAAPAPPKPRKIRF